MKEYKAQLIGVGIQQASATSIENSLNIAALERWELVCVSDGWAFYVRERQAKSNQTEQEKQS